MSGNGEKKIKQKSDADTDILIVEQIYFNLYKATTTWVDFFKIIPKKSPFSPLKQFGLVVGHYGGKHKGLGSVLLQFISLFNT